MDGYLLNIRFVTIFPFFGDTGFGLIRQLSPFWFGWIIYFQLENQLLGLVGPSGVSMEVPQDVLPSLELFFQEEGKRNADSTKQIRLQDLGADNAVGGASGNADANVNTNANTNVNADADANANTNTNVDLRC